MRTILGFKRKKFPGVYPGDLIKRGGRLGLQAINYIQ